MTATKTKNPTLLEQAKERLDAHQSTVDIHEKREAALALEVAELQRQADAGELEYDALRHIQAEAELAAERRWLEVHRPHLDTHRKVHASHALAPGVGDLGAGEEALAVKRAATVDAMRHALKEYVEAVNAHNSELTGLIGEARQAGLIEEEVDPTLPVVMGGGTHGHPRHLTYNGERHVILAANTDSIIQEARR